MKILAIDTATEACSVALLDENSVNEIFEIIPRQHTERVLPMVDDILKQSGYALSQMDALAFNCGPGSFTGVRVATSVIQGLAFSAERPVVPVSSLAALAQLAFRLEKKEHVLSLIDARMNEMYWACYSSYDGIMQLDETINKKENVSAADQVRSVNKESNKSQWHAIGSGWDTFKNELNQSQQVNIISATLDSFPHAQDIAVLAQHAFKQGKAVSAEQAVPTYVRNEVTWKKLKDQ